MAKRSFPTRSERSSDPRTGPGSGRSGPSDGARPGSDVLGTPGFGDAGLEFRAFVVYPGAAADWKVVRDGTNAPESFRELRAALDHAWRLARAAAPAWVFVENEHGVVERQWHIGGEAPLRATEPRTRWS
jgi:hypothetical protein